MKFLSSILKSILSISNLQSAGIFLFFASIWMISGFFVETEIPTKQVVIEENTVRVMKQSAQPFARNIILKGSAEADKNVQLSISTVLFSPEIYIPIIAFFIILIIAFLMKRIYFK